MREGNAKRGEAVFRRKESLCLNCHAIAGAGGQVGPGLESIGASAPADYLVDALLQPGKAIKEGYHATTVAMSDGRVITGIKVRQTDTALVLRDAEDRELTLPLDAIDEQKPAGSLMPAGLVDTLTETDRLDLVKFLSELGKIGPYSVSKDRIMRRWRILDMTPVSLQSIRRWGRDAAVVDDSLPWVASYSEVSGVLPLDALPAAPELSLSIVRGQIDVTTGGPVQLAFNTTDGLVLWLDGKKVKLQPRTILDLAPGIHTLALQVDRGRRREGILLTLEDAPGSPARAQVVLGK